MPLQAKVDEFNINKKRKRGKELTLEYLENDVRIIEYCSNLFVKLNKNTYKINPLHFISLLDSSFDCFLKLSKVELDTIQDEQLLKDFNSAIRAGICGVKGNRYVNNDSMTIWYIEANNLYGYALMQKLPHIDFEYSNVTLDEEVYMLQSILNTPDDSANSYWVICD